MIQEDPFIEIEKLVKSLPFCEMMFSAYYKYYKQVKTNGIISQRFGDLMMPLSRNELMREISKEVTFIYTLHVRV